MKSGSAPSVPFVNCPRFNALSGCFIPSSSSQNKGVINTGDFTGWTVGGTVPGDNAVVTSYTPQFIVTNTWSPALPFYDNYTLRLGSTDMGTVPYDNSHQSWASQTGTSSQEDVDNGLKLYFRWAAFLEEPTNSYHSDANMPYFSVKLSAYDSGWSQIYFFDQRANEAGFTNVGNAYSAAFSGIIWYGTDVVSVDLAALGLGLNDQVKLELFVQDCQQGGHGAIAFLDGFSTSKPPDYDVPEPATMLLLGFGLVGLAGVRRKIKKYQNVLSV